jgi:endonuclease YncB( thermonuclease family)
MTDNARLRAMARPWWARARGWAALAALAVVALADHHGWLLARPERDHAIYDARLVRVQRVIDGDTIEVDVADATLGHETTRVRLIGIDAPELTRAGGEPEPGARRAAETLRDITLGRLVLLALEPDAARDRWGRILAHVERPDGVLLAETLLGRGAVTVDERSPHRHLRRYAAAERDARRAGRGIWQTGEP